MWRVRAFMQVVLGTLDTQQALKDKLAQHMARCCPMILDEQRANARRLLARREVIVAAGAFNSPQLLMLSGVGPRAELEYWRTRMAKFNSITEQLKGRECKIVLGVENTVQFKAGDHQTPATSAVFNSREWV